MRGEIFRLKKVFMGNVGSSYQFPIPFNYGPALLVPLLWPHN